MHGLHHTSPPRFLTKIHGEETPSPLTSREGEGKQAPLTRGAPVHPALHGQLCPRSCCGCEFGLCPTPSSGSHGSRASWPSGRVTATRTGRAGLAPAGVHRLTRPVAQGRQLGQPREGQQEEQGCGCGPPALRCPITEWPSRGATVPIPRGGAGASGQQSRACHPGTHLPPPPLRPHAG